MQAVGRCMVQVAWRRKERERWGRQRPCVRLAGRDWAGLDSIMDHGESSRAGIANESVCDVTV